MQSALTTVSRASWLAAFLVLSCGGRVGGNIVGGGGSPSETGGTPSMSIGATSSTSVGGSIIGTSAASGGTGNTGTPAIGGEGWGCPDLVYLPGLNGCGSSTVQLQYSKSNVLIVLDKSMSMTSTPSGYIKSKWLGVIDAFKAALAPSDMLVSYGLLLYPYASPVSASSCELTDDATGVNIGIGPAADTVPVMVDLMINTSPGGGTPTAAALRAALDFYTNGPGSALEGAKYVLLITDGGPNCNLSMMCGPETCTANMDAISTCGTATYNCCDDSMMAAGGLSPKLVCLDHEAVKAQLDALRAAGVKSFIVGIPGTEPYADYLDVFAETGGVPLLGQARKYYEVKSEPDLQGALQTIMDSLTRQCEVPLVEAPRDIAKLNVAVDCAVLPQRSGDTVNWVYDATTQSIVIVGPKCDIMKAVGTTRVDVVAGCSGPSID